MKSLLLTILLAAPASAGKFYNLETYPSSASMHVGYEEPGSIRPGLNKDRVFTSSGAAVVQATTTTSGHKPFRVKDKAGADVLTVDVAGNITGGGVGLTGIPSTASVTAAQLAATNAGITAASTGTAAALLATANLAASTVAYATHSGDGAAALASTVAYASFAGDAPDSGFRGSTIAYATNSGDGAAALASTVAYATYAGAATALTADPSDCAGNEFALGVNASGTAACAQPADVTGNAATVTNGAYTNNNNHFSVMQSLDAGVTTTSGTFTATGATQYSIRASSGIYSDKEIVSATDVCISGSKCLSQAGTGTGDAVKANNETITGKWTFTGQPISNWLPVMVASYTAAAASEITFNGLESSSTYRLIYNLKWGTASGNVILRFNGDSGNNYRYYTVSYYDNASSAYANSGGTSGCLLTQSGNTPDVGLATEGHIDFARGYNVDAQRLARGMTSTVVNSGYLGMNNFSCYHKTSLGLTSVTLVPDAGDMTGLVTLWKMGGNWP